MDWESVEKKFRKLLRAEGYEQAAAEELAFYIRQNLENAEPLFEFAKETNGDRASESEAKIEELMVQVHMLLSNPENMRRAIRSSCSKMSPNRSRWARRSEWDQKF